jgi:purine-binding chemotaxis protein CheW
VARVAPGTAEQLLTFRLGGQRYGLPAGRVREVARMPRLARVPHAPPSLLGLANFRGSVLPVLSFAALTGQPGGREARVILLDGAEPVGIAVDEVNALISGSGPETDAVRQVEIDALVAASLGGQATRRSQGMGSAAVTAVTAVSRADEVPLVVFALGRQEFALPLGAVEEIVRLPEDVTLMPHGDAVVVGSTTVRGALLPLLSLEALLALPAAADRSRARVVVIRIGAHRVGLVVDAMHAILRVAESQIDPVPTVLSRGSAETRIQAICRLDEGRRLVSVLAVEQLLREDITARLLQSGKEEAMAEDQIQAISEQFLLFRIGDEEFGLPIAAVEEVASLPPKLTRLPKAPAFVQGVMNLRGNVIPVIDQVQRFGGTAATGRKRRVVIVRIDALQAGFIVDAVSEVLRIPVDALRDVPELGAEGTRVFERVANLEDEQRIVLIVSPRELLDRAERDLLAALGKKATVAGS